MQCGTIAIILGGGKGTRLYPLTKDRAKPAVPIAGKFRLIDMPISNCLHSGIDRIFVLTQFSAASLTRHIAQTYRFDAFSRGYVQILAAQQTLEGSDWYQGTADAVRQNLRRFEDTSCDHVVVLAGDHLYKMDYQKMIQEHIDKGAEITVAVLPLERDQVKEFGILKTDPDGSVTEFMEKPQEERQIDAMEINGETFQQRGIEALGKSHVASMGIYVFDKSVLIECLRDEGMVDFGKNVIPAAIGTREIYAHFFDGYWRDVGTVGSFFQAHMELTRTVPEFDFYDESALVYTHPRFLPGTKINSSIVQSSILCEGSIITECEIRSSIIGVRSIVRSGAEITNSVIMGADSYEMTEDDCSLTPDGLPPIGIGRGSVIRNTIVDKDARIGRNVRIINRQEREDYDDSTYSIRDKIVVVHKDAVIPDNTVI
ncbi:glucose-1-phosphate adenylyltransferase [Candidatus Poribacteria bacterium]